MLLKQTCTKCLKTDNNIEQDVFALMNQHKWPWSWSYIGLWKMNSSFYKFCAQICYGKLTTARLILEIAIFKTFELVFGKKCIKPKSNNPLLSYCKRKKWNITLLPLLFLQMSLKNIFILDTGKRHQNT